MNNTNKTKNTVSNRSKQLSWLTILLVLFLQPLSSCTPAYVPTKVNTGLFTNEGEFHAEGAYVLDDMMDVQVGYLLPGGVIAIANASFRNTELDEPDPSSDVQALFDSRSRHQVYEFGWGYQHKTKSDVVVELIGGYGRGKVDNLEVLDLFGKNEFYINADYNKFFLQPTIGFSQKNFDLGFSARFANVQLDIVENSEKKQFSNYFFEPAITIRLGLEYFKVTSQVGVNTLREHIDRAPYSWKYINLSVGLMMDLDFGKKGKVMRFFEMVSIISASNSTSSL